MNPASDIIGAERFVAEPRTYRVEYNRDLRLGARFHWRLYAYGGGHWCMSNGHAASFSSETEAHGAGKRWLTEGKIR